MKDRARLLNKHSEITDGTIVYWMSRDQRVHDNWALLYAQHLAKKYHQPLCVIFCLQSSFLGATLRQFDFMLNGLLEVSNELHAYNIPFFIIEETPEKSLTWLNNNTKLGAIVTDFSPLRIGREWRETVAKRFEIPVIEVDAHNIIPAWIASDKQEFAAYTFRPKVHKKLDEFLVHFPILTGNREQVTGNSELRQQLALPTFKKNKLIITSTKKWEQVTVETLLQSMSNLNSDVKPMTWCKPGEKAALLALDTFLEKGLDTYDEKRNDPNQDAQSNLSPYLHFGQLASQTVALAIQSHTKANANTNAFLEELIVRKELSDNFCFYNSKYDSVEGIAAWATKTLQEHASDKREFLYTLQELEEAKTYDELWNASQLEMVKTGKMHGYMRMYWAKKILEWTASPKVAIEYAIYLNDKYELDGRDPNGYVGILWSIGGVHDRAWFERPIFGKIRYMNFNGAKRKFDVKKYIDSIKNVK